MGDISYLTDNYNEKIDEIKLIAINVIYSIINDASVGCNKYYFNVILLKGWFIKRWKVKK